MNAETVRQWFIKAENDLKTGNDELQTELTVKNIDELTPHATVLRYPDDFYIPPVKEARHAMHLAEYVKHFVLELLRQQGFTEKEHEGRHAQ